MESRQLPVLSLDIGNNNAESDFDLGLLSAGSTSSWYATSSYGPRTPASGRSTPHFMTGFDLNSSFSSTTTDGFNFVELTPSSNKSGHLPMTPTTPMSEGMVDMCSSGLSGTPRGGEQHDGHGLPPSFTMGPFLDDAHAAMSFHNDYSMTTDDFGIHPLVSGPSVPTPFGHISNPHFAQWTYPESPIRFDIDSPNRRTHTVQRLKREPGDNESLPSTPSRTSSVHDDPFTPTPPSTPDSVVSGKRLHMMNQARHRTTVLQRQVHQAAAAGPSCLGRRVKKESIPGLIDEAEGTSAFTVERAAKFKCPLEGCSRMFRRKEHWKRHINTYVFLFHPLTPTNTFN
jgi:hypothetical protein